LSFAHGCWLRPRQGQRQGDGGEQREEGRASRVSLWCKLPRCLPSKMRAFKPITRMLRREAWPGGRALLAGPFPFLLAGPSPFLLADLSLFFPFSQCPSHCHSQSSLQTTRNCILNFTGSPGVAGAVAPAISGRPGPTLGCPLGQPKIVIYSGSRTGCTSLEQMYYSGGVVSTCMIRYFEISFDYVLCRTYAWALAPFMCVFVAYKSAYKHFCIATHNVACLYPGFICAHPRDPQWCRQQPDVAGCAASFCVLLDTPSGGGSS